MGLEVEMHGANGFSARFDDLLLTITPHGESWRAKVEEAGDPRGALSSGTDYASVERAKQGAVSIALELFGTGIPAEELKWQPTR